MSLPARVGRYEVELVLGEGEVDQLLLARDPVLARPVAIRLLRDDLALTSEQRAHMADQLTQEGRALAALSHPAIVTLHDMGTEDPAGPYLVFELIRGTTLRERVSRGPLPPIEVAALARSLGAALSQAHAAGVVHRRLSPEAVILSPVGPKLTDFGLALRGAASAAYAAPEGLASGAFSAPGDQFSFAATLYEALTGAPAFTGKDAEAVASNVSKTKHAAPSGVAPGLRRFAHLDVIFDRGLAKEARQRFATCEAFGSALATELEGTNAAFLTPPPASSIVPRATRRLQNAFAVAAVLVIGALLILGRPRHTEVEGVSLRRVASSFASAITSPAPTSAGHRAPPAAPASSSAKPALGAPKER